MKRLIATFVSTAILAGCATAPNQAGHGVGSSYTPVVDTQGIDSTRFQRDLDECRVYANQVSPLENAAGAAVAGAIFLGVLSAALGGHSRVNGYNAAGGAISAGAGAAAGSLQKQQGIISNCLIGRGYKVLG